MRTENEIREQIKYLETPNEIAGLPVDGSIAASWLKWVLNAEQGGNVAKPNACSQLCDVTALKEYIRSCIDNFSRHNKDHPEDTTNSAFQFAFEGIMRKIDELCKV